MSLYSLLKDLTIFNAHIKLHAHDRNFYFIKECAEN